jgi:hypothetical protein
MVHAAVAVAVVVVVVVVGGGGAVAGADRYHHVYLQFSIGIVVASEQYSESVDSLNHLLPEQAYQLDMIYYELITFQVKIFDHNTDIHLMYHYMLVEIIHSFLLLFSFPLLHHLYLSCSHMDL